MWLILFATIFATKIEVIFHGNPIANALNCKCGYNNLSINIVIVILFCVCGTISMRAKRKIIYYKLHLMKFNQN
jgi:hypothetical protein